MVWFTIISSLFCSAARIAPLAPPTAAAFAAVGVTGREPPVMKLRPDGQGLLLLLVTSLLLLVGFRLVMSYPTLPDFGILVLMCSLGSCTWSATRGLTLIMHSCSSLSLEAFDLILSMVCFRSGSSTAIQLDQWLFYCTTISRYARRFAAMQGGIVRTGPAFYTGV